MRAGCAGQSGVPQQQRDQAGFQGDPGEFGGAGDGLGQLRRGHRRQDVEAFGEDGGEFRQVETSAGEVGAQAEDDHRGIVAGGRRGRGERAQHTGEGTALRLVGAKGEQFLQLVDEQHEPGRWGWPASGRGRVRAGPDGGEQGLGPLAQPVGGEVQVAAEDLGGAFQQLVQRVGGRRTGDDRPAVGTRHREATGPPESGHETGVEQGRLAGARGGDEQQRPLADPAEDPLHERRRGPLPAEEAAGVLRRERRQARVGAGGAGVIGCAAGDSGGAADRIGGAGLRRARWCDQAQQLAVGAQDLVAAAGDVDGGALRAGLDLAQVPLAVVGLSGQVGERQTALLPQSA